MRITHTGVPDPIRARSLRDRIPTFAALALALGIAMPASAQVNPIVFDGNIVFNASGGL